MSLIRKLLFGVVLNGLTLFLLVLLIDTINYSGGLKLFLLAGLILGVLNAFVKPLMKILSFPLMFMTAGLFIVVINMVILWLMTYLLDVIQFRDVRLDFPDLKTYVISALVFGLLNWFIGVLFKK